LRGCLSTCSAVSVSLVCTARQQTEACKRYILYCTLTFKFGDIQNGRSNHSSLIKTQGTRRR
jgi:hypothetical protein